MKIFLPLFILGLMLTGCSGKSWLARFEIVRAEEAYNRAHEMRTKKAPYEKRLKLYRKACDHFFRAYELYPEAFTLYRIEIAEETCFRVENTPSREAFAAFREEYIRTHPTETEYGDAVPMMEIE